MKKQYWNNKNDFNRSDNRTDNSDEIPFRGSKVEVRNGDVNYALRKLKKILERNDWQKDIAKKEYFEKGSVTRKRRQRLDEESMLHRLRRRNGKS